MSRTGKDPNGQDDVDAIFGEIVADLRAEGVGARIDTERPDEPSSDDGPDEDHWLDGEDDTDRHEGRTGNHTGQEQSHPRPATSDWRASEVGWDETMLSDSDSVTDDDDEHFVPPEPPPLPKPSRSMGIVALFVVVGLVLLVAPHIIGIGVNVATPLGMLSLAAGLGFLLLRARDDNRPPGADPDNGAQV
ncbi:hypothetical protein [Haloechinothrix salitolerans]|uniref:DUF308 domain-containing protein n=1 Tax=Haloechinothrix salitolerans TaxID=926830 RepID=A0ABW2C2P9_9PSEU